MWKTLKKTLKSKPAADPGYIFHTNLTYPTIEGNLSNFISDYQANAASYNGYAILKRGSQEFEYDEEDYDSAWEAFSELSGYVTDIHLENWARLYYALSLSYNPLYNVDGTTIRTTSERERTDAYGATSGNNTLGAISAQDVHGAQTNQTTYGAVSKSDVHGAQSGSTVYGAVSESDVHGAQSGSTIYGAISETDVHGAESESLGSHTDTQTNSSLSFDGSTERVTGSTSNAFGAQTNTKASVTDTHDADSRTDSTSSASYTDSHSEQSRTDSTSSQQYTDTHSEQSRTDTSSANSYTDSHTEQARQDTHSESAHSDTHTDSEFTETEERRGNIGVTMSQQLLNAEWELRKRSFFEHIIYQMLDEIGFIYRGGIGL